jgi:hypothetical protein
MKLSAETKSELLKKSLEIGITIPLGIILLSLPTYWVWNAIMPSKFNLPCLTFGETIGIQFLIYLLFGRLGARS